MFPASQNIVEEVRLKELEGQFARRFFDHSKQKSDWEIEREIAERRQDPEVKEPQTAVVHLGVRFGFSG